jgi:hypothetical protein
MKYLFAVMLILTTGMVNAQSPRSISLNVYGGYTFQDRVRLDEFHVDVNDGFEYGGGLEYFVRRNKSIEIKYLRMDTRFPLYGPGGSQLNTKTDGALNFLLLGGNNYFARTTDQKAIPYAGVDLGIGWADGREESSGVKFAWDAKIGVKLMTSSAVSFKLQAYVQSMISAFGTDYWYYPGWGTVAVSDYAHVFQFGLGGAVCFGKNK